MRFTLVLSLVAVLLPVSVSAQTETNRSTEDVVAFIVEADTYAPAFYNGRPEPTPGSRVHVSGFVRDPQSNSYTFLFETPVGNESMTTNAPFSTTSFTMPQLGDVRVKLSVRDGEGRLIGSSERYIAATSPRLSFFPQNLLRGMSQNAIRDSYRLISDEVTIQAVPFFINAPNIDTSYEETWRRDGTEVQERSITAPTRQLTISRRDDVAREQIEYEIYNTQAVTQGIGGTFDILYE